MTPLRFFSLGGVLLLAAIGCSKEKTFTEPSVPMAGVHYLNAVPDTGQMDFRVVDIVSSAGLYDANFRTGNMFYSPIEAGSRDVRVFLSSQDPTISSHIMWDTTYTFTAGVSYKFIHVGFSRVGQVPARTVWVLQDNPPTPATGQVGVRFIHAGAGMGNVDVRVIRVGTDTLPDTPLFANVAYGQQTAYASLKADSFSVLKKTNGNDSLLLFRDTLRVVVTAVGTKTPRLFTTALPLGLPGSNQFDPTKLFPFNPVAGAAIPLSVLTAVIVPASVAGSQAPAGFTTPSIVSFVDKRPPDTVP